QYSGKFSPWQNRTREFEGGRNDARALPFLHGYLPMIFRIVMEYAGRSRVKSAQRPSTFVLTGTILAGSVIELVSSGAFALMTTASPLASMFLRPLISTRTG